MELEDIEKDRKIAKDFASWIVRAGRKYITGLPCGYSTSDISKSIRNLARHDIIMSRSVDRIKRSFT